MILDSFRLRWLLAGGALAASILLACAEDTPGTGEGIDDAKEPSERTRRDAGRDGGRRDARAADPDDEADDDGDDEDACTNRQVRECDDCAESTCAQTCASGKWGACRGVLEQVSDLREAGVIPSIPDGAVQVVDGGVSVSFGDASVTLPTMDCPGMFECASKGMGIAGMILSTSLGGASFCATPNDPLGLPPACTAPADCQKLGFTQAMCTALPGFGSYCIQLCQ